MIRSMTGYGRGECEGGGRSVTVELRAVNNRYLDCGVKIPRAYLFLEDAVKSRVQKGVARGKVDVFITVLTQEGEGVKVTVNRKAAEEYIAALEELSALCGERKVRREFSVMDLARFQEVLTVEKEPEDVESLREVVLTALEGALAEFNAMRAREGERLVQDIRDRAATIEALLTQVEEKAPLTASDYRRRLEAKMAEVLQNTQLEESRILAEAAIYADKIAVDEETVRLHSHLRQLEEFLQAGGAVGRKLDFLIQEFNREANTIGSKCSDLAVSRLVVDMKAEIEKIREQVQNIE